MQSFIVLGIIPGTNIQTNLNFWIIISTVLLLFAFRMQLVALRNTVQMFIVMRRIARTIDQFELTTI